MPIEGGFPNNGNGGFTYDAVFSGLSTLTLDQSISIQKLTVTGGCTVTGAFDLTTNDALHWTDGTMSGAGTTNANGGAQFDGYQEFVDGRTLNIAAPATFTGNVGTQAGYLYVSNGATLNNSSTFDAGWAANFNNNIGANGVPGTFSNSGTFTRSVGSGATIVTVPFNNSGIVNVQAGTVALNAGGMDSGSFQATAGTTLGFAGPTTLTSTAILSVGGTLNVNGPTTLNTSLLTGSGTLSILSNGTLTVTPNISTSLALNIVGGTLNGGGTVTFGGAVHWTDGTMSGAGTTTANGGAATRRLSRIRRCPDAEHRRPRHVHRQRRRPGGLSVRVERGDGQQLEHLRCRLGGQLQQQHRPQWRRPARSTTRALSPVPSAAARPS